jgi:AcrR family transcriptional regulator
LGYVEPVCPAGEVAKEIMTAKKTAAKTYHHGDLRNTLRDAARTILEEEGLAALSLRAVARRAGVSHGAPYRHFPNHEALLVELVTEGFAELRQGIAAAVAGPAQETDRITAIGAAYMRFVAQRPGVARLMFGTQIPNRNNFPELASAADSIGEQISAALINPALGLAVWSAVHGLAMLVLDDLIDLGQRRAGQNVLPSRAEIVLRSLFT